MTIPVWPADLPARPLQSGYSRGVGNGRLFSQRSAGPPGVRRRTSAATKAVAAQIMCSTDEAARFQTFWDSDTKGGVLPFLTIDPMFDGQPLATEDGDGVLTSDGAPLLIASWLFVRFGEAEPQIQPAGGLYYNVSFELLILPT